MPPRFLFSWSPSPQEPPVRGFWCCNSPGFLQRKMVGCFSTLEQPFRSKAALVFPGPQPCSTPSPNLEHPALQRLSALGHCLPQLLGWHFLVQTARRFFSISCTPPAPTPTQVLEYCLLGLQTRERVPPSIKRSDGHITSMATICWVHLSPLSIPLHG